MSKRRKVSHLPKKEEKTYRSLIEMVGDSLDVHPSSLQRQQQSPPPPQPNIPFTSNREGTLEQNYASSSPPPPGGPLPPPPSTNKVPANLFEQLSGPDHSMIGSTNLFPPMFTPPAPPMNSDRGGLFVQQQQKQGHGLGKQPLLADPQHQQRSGSGILPNPQATNISLLPPSFFTRQPFQATTFNPQMLPPITTTTYSSTSVQPPSGDSQSSLQKAACQPRRRKMSLEMSRIQDTYHKPDTFWLILMRGLPGSGKTYRSRGIAGPKGVVLSTDDFFMKNKSQSYEYDPTKIQEAHSWNITRARKSMEKKCSPVVIDNTNLEAWQMKPYAAMARRYKYELDIYEVENEWCLDTAKLAKSNTHGVSLQVIERMKERYQRNITVESLMAMLTPSAARKNQNNSSEADPPIPSPRNQADRENTPTPQPRKDLPPHSRRPSIDKVESSLGDLYFDCNYKIAVGGEEASAVGQTTNPSGGAIPKTPSKNNNHTQHEKKTDATPKDTPKSPSNDSDSVVKDSTGKKLTAKQLNIRQNLHALFPTVDKVAMDNVLESVSFNLEAASNFIRSSGVQEEDPVIITKSSTPSSSSSKSNMEQQPQPSSNKKSNNRDSLSMSNSPDLGFFASSPPNVHRTSTAVTSEPNSTPSPRSKGKLEKIIDSYRTNPDAASGSGASAMKDAATATATETSSATTTPKSYQDDLKNFNDSNLEFLYEAFPDLKKGYCRGWLRRYNGDLIKTCDYLTRVSHVELPQNEDEDVVEFDEEEENDEDIEMIDLTHDRDSDDDIEDQTVHKDGRRGPTSKKKLAAPTAGEIFLHEDESDEGVEGGSDGVRRNREEVRVAIDKSFALEMKKRFGQEGDFSDGDLQYDDFVFDLTKEAAQQIYQVWTHSLRVKKRKLDNIDKDEELAKRLQKEENENKTRRTPSKQQAKKMRTLDIDTRDKQAAQPKSPWKKMDDQHLTPVEGIGGGRLTLAQVNAREQLHSMFPGANEEALDQVLEASNYNLDAAAKLVTSSTGAERNDSLQNDLNDTAWQKVTSPPRKPRPPPDQQEGEPIAIEDDDGYYQNTGSDNVSYQDLRAEAELHGQLRRECLQKAAEAFQAKNGLVAQHHANEAKEHEHRMKDAHFRAAEMMLQRRNRDYMKEQKVIDLHGLHVKEAMGALMNFLENATKLKHKVVTVITGRGNHSKNGFSAIRNRVLAYLTQNGYSFNMEGNGGAVRIRLR